MRAKNTLPETETMISAQLHEGTVFFCNDCVSFCTVFFFKDLTFELKKAGQKAGKGRLFHDGKSCEIVTHTH